ncbi:MAG TPA: leucine-rich repeat domain-containing protein [Candidatus Bacteroides merdigallinarum]|uniref:Leucine-rich repeat domain-containing protein n=1 Tax=Candidatus Bacteroides merdigallinarum TaxID=2838473 RepID=A0A9D2EAA6_9BACE|nr:leucine-rich repeat domain-containing protein [Candidatus Bacteroides merdigallinarum]
MKRNKLLMLAIALLATLPVFSQKTKKIYVPKAGTMVEMLTEEEANQITHLRLQGKLNAVDFRHLRDEFKQLRSLDISQASISLYAGKGGTQEGFHIYPANTLPAYAFCKERDEFAYIGKETLRRIILPAGLREIGKAAFKGCSQLGICQIRDTHAPRLASEALADSLTAIFVPEGSSNTYRSREEWNNFALMEGEPTGAKVQISRMGSLASELVQKGKQPKDINFLTVEGKLDEADFSLIRDYMPNLVYIHMENCNAKVIPAYTFTQKKFLLKVVLPKELKSIGQRAFSGCTRLCGTLVLPPTLTAIEFGAFIGCDNLHQVVATGNQITTLGDKLFGEEESKLVYR